MSNKKTEVKPVSEFYIVNAVAKLANLGDWAKVENFVSKTVKVLESEIVTAERNIVNAKHNATNSMIVLKENLEDAEAELEDTFVSINLSKIQNNKDAASYREDYLSSISKANKVIELAKKDIEVQKIAAEKIIEEYNKEISIRKSYIKSLSKGKK